MTMMQRMQQAEEALAAMAVGQWQRALSLWHQVEKAGLLLEKRHFHAYARTCEVLQSWEQHRELLRRGLQQFPGDWGLGLRLEYNTAVDLLLCGQWLESFELFSRLARCKGFEEWPFSLDFYRWHALLNLKLTGIEVPDKRLELLDRWSTFRSEGIRSSQIAGLQLVIPLMDWDEALKTEFSAASAPMLDYLKSVDGFLWHIQDPVAKSCMQDLAQLARRHLQCIATLPVSFIGFFASFFLLFGCTDLYARLRHIFVTELGSARIQARGNLRLVELMHQLMHANEHGDQIRFESLCHLVHRDLLGDGRDNLLHFMKFSELYYRPQTVIDFSVLGMTEKDKLFAAYLQGKSIAIVGPVDVGLESGAEIDGFDVVVRLNHRTNNALCTRRFGTRTDVSYYLYNDLQDGGVEHCLRAMRELRFAVLDQLSMQNYEFSKIGQCQSRQALNVGVYGCNPLLMGYANGIQRMLMDLARFPLGRVKVFNANLYLSKGYAGNYLQGKSADFFRAFSLHDPLSNFIFTKRMFDLGWLEADPVLREVLQFDADTYAEMLFQVHIG
ncbi:hypothetical protein [Pseudomonas sp.]|uniref:hypothetical protein n=1 Tax=Pseudomonas sp. TaxID=306 RepID=UPI002C91089E|nr:hypothetical protein [Pseudomonas sp.]HUE91261.1 hypothetical protein [Pseudomonas sp.]